MKADLLNNLPEKHKPVKLKADETVVYRLTTIKPDPHNQGRFLIPASINVPAFDEVVIEDETYPIGYVEKVTPDGEAIFGEIIITKNMGGMLALRGNNPKHRRMYEYIELCSWNRSSKFRTPSKNAFIERIDEGKSSEANRAERRELMEALNAASSLKKDELKAVAASLGMNTNKEESILRDRIEDYAETNPSEFMLIAKQKTNKIQSILREAVDLQIVKHEPNLAKFVWKESKEEIFKYKKGAGVKVYELLAEHLQNKDADTLEAITTRVEAERDNS